MSRNATLKPMTKTTYNKISTKPKKSDNTEQHTTTITYQSSLSQKIHNKYSNMQQALSTEVQILKRQYAFATMYYKFSRMIVQHEKNIKITVACVFCFFTIITLIFRKKIANGLIFLLAPIGTYTKDTYPIE